MQPLKHHFVCPTAPLLEERSEEEGEEEEEDKDGLLFSFAARHFVLHCGPQV